MNKKVSSTWILLSLAISAFAIGSTEFISVGIMPLLTKTFGISLAQGGLTVSIYATGIMFGAPILALLTNRWDRKKLLIGIMISFIIGNTLAAIAPSFAILLVGRVIAALSHGIFMTIASLIAADVVAPNKRASAIAVMFTGLTVATITGVPIGTFIGNTLGWRLSFFFLVALGLVGLITNIILVPNELPLPKPTSVKGIWKILKQPQLLLILLITALGYGATFPVYTYLTTILNKNMNWSQNAIVVILIFYGVAVAIGNTLGGKWANKRPLPALLKMFVGLGVALVVMRFFINLHFLGLLAVMLLGLFAFMNVPGLQLYIVQLAEKYTPNEVPLASALNISAFNVGITLGSTIGGQAVAHSQLVNTPWLGVAMLVVDVLLIGILIKMENNVKVEDLDLENC
ncbi:MFS transporter [Companilactobacillus pabuli]|jgi:predicted MFS family arabinose efflux permease|uniref:MFS transporter n=1 Tax=Companilactobacillus pabuli TaxID=2714036 RepID=A0A7L7KW15_9LACO|nr:MFS transporter [Companilactobacillus pabuli]AKP03131.1 MFS sugar transporter [Companilactobacillus farciminis]AKS51431.1 MFS sugar transporter [Companilactobacillus farciminis]MDG5112220.1 MFS transporter [Companilactobacillus pabuli]QMT83194.1 MFS transporter [Companilactobacillus pabuli]GAQ01846.1 MFS sugar transporter [Companilactobacillus farciminis]